MSASSPARQVDPRTRGAHRPPLVGRAGELRAFRALLRAASAGRTVGVLVDGEFGSGKSALLAEVAAQARDLGFTAASAVATRLESELRGAVVGQLAEDLLDGPGDVAPSLEAFLQLVRASVERAPLLLVVDDAHVADAWSLRCLAYLLRRLRDRPLLVVLSSATGQPPAADLLLSELLPEDHHLLRLPRLTPDAVADLLAGVLPAPLPEGLAAAAHEATAGNPRLLESLVAVLRARAALGPKARITRTPGPAGFGAQAPGRSGADTPGRPGPGDTAGGGPGSGPAARGRSSGAVPQGGATPGDAVRSSVDPGPGTGVPAVVGPGATPPGRAGFDPASFAPAEFDPTGFDPTGLAPGTPAAFDVAALVPSGFGSASLVPAAFGVSALATDLDPADLDPAALDPAEVAGLAAPELGELLRLRLRVRPGAAEVVRATAVLGEDATVDRVAELAGVEHREVLALVDALVRLRLLRDGTPLAFNHPYLRACVLADLPVATRAADHARAASALAEAGEPARRVAAHLRQAHDVPLPWGVPVLREAARSALRAGDPAEARACLERALRERAAPAERLGARLELVHAVFLADPAEGASLLRESLVLADDTGLAADQAAQLLLRLCRPVDARFALALGPQLVARLGPADHDRSWRLRALCFLAGAGNNPGLALRAGVLLRELEAEPPTSPELRQTRSALLALGHALRGDSAARAAGHAELALTGPDTGVLTRPFAFAVATCFLADSPRLSEGLRHALGSRAEPRDHHLDRGAALALAQGLHHLATGDLVRANTFLKWQLRLFAEQSAPPRDRLGDRPADAGEWAGPVEDCPMAVLCAARLTEALVDLGRFDEARELLAKHGLTDRLPEVFGHNTTLWARGRLKLAGGDAEGALTDARECGRRLAAAQLGSAPLLPWRPLAVRALLALGRRDQAVRLAGEELAVARRWGAPRALGVALLAVGLTSEDDAGTRALAQAVQHLEGTTARLALAEALCELGARLRRRGRPERAIPHLRRAVELSAACEAKPLIARAGEELRACEPTTVQGTEHGLTRQEVRVAGMAAQGLTNRQIAEALFLTRRTVELHLSGAYRKLGIAGRADLPAALTPPVPPAG
ncbi:AAA family ATPase [Actinosynnema mirum]|uniref:Transcriptional regulator, LuxR family n=1 Tax=Actinosynnema mirum (strain ATCC 29888 / DSM 43827 / JCM 3225 / NBRC 14064 / NCIMB 13271 / NRRL B-12336 / IMRU 3971 / 101) TaxID=446462 RepID=C6WQ76_ACTMD|nr:AAA family ATPase [Actinosynnema mirum]ACU35132.1 transcriptional regulator, LuxR family [Actinosynnema mirum DSM 43827]